MLAAVVERTARLTARWMAAGFVHGVLNTDNMNVTGESFDYGPWRFLPKSDGGFTAAYFDHNGLYAFGRQPEAAFWNLQQLASTLTLVADADSLIEELNRFERLYSEELVAAFIARLGVKPADRDADIALVQAAFQTLAQLGEAIRWEPFFFDWFCGPASAGRAMNGPRRAAYDGEAAQGFRALLMSREPDRPERLDHAYFARSDPEEMLIDEVEAIWAPIAERDDWSLLDAKLGRLSQARDGWGLAL